MSSKSPNILYITREIERALAQEPVDNYFILTNKTPYSITIKEKYPDNVHIVESPSLLDTYELLTLPETAALVPKYNAHVLVFKNTTHIEEFCKNKNWKLLNPSAELSEIVENKISQVKWLGELSSLLPPHSITFTKDVMWQKKPFILQWSHGHTGGGTVLVRNANELKFLQDKFPHREARVSDFIKGPMFTMNIAVSAQNIILGNLSYQITGMLPFTENVFSTIGNDWALPHTILTEAQLGKIDTIAHKVAERMRKSGWKGLFGIDVILDEERDEIHLIEINARQPASTTYESHLQKKIGLEGNTIFEIHLDSLLNPSSERKIIPINDGAQIVQRVTSTSKDLEDKKLTEAGYETIKYPNFKPNLDFIRIRSSRGIMETHNKLNSRGKEILNLLYNLESGLEPEKSS